MRLKKATFTGALVGLLAAAALLAPACAGNTTTTAASPTTATVATTAAATSAGTTESYRSEMKALWDRYGGTLHSLSATLGSLDLSDTGDASAHQLQTLQDSTDSVAAYASGVEAIKAPADVAGAHAAYMRVIRELSGALSQLAAAVQSKRSSDYVAAAANFATVVGKEQAAMTEAQATLEKTLGFSLHDSPPSGSATTAITGGSVTTGTTGSATSDTTTDTATHTTGSTTTTADALGPDAKAYTNAMTGYSFRYPAAWGIDTGATTDVQSGGGATSSVGAYDPTGTQAGGVFIDLMVVSPSNVNITVTDDMIPSLQSQIQSVLDGLQGRVTNMQIVAPLAQTEQAGLKGYEVTYTFSKGGVPATSTLYFLFKGDMEYQLNIQASSDHWDKDQAIFAAMVASFSAR